VPAAESCLVPCSLSASLALAPPTHRRPWLPRTTGRPQLPRWV